MSKELKFAELVLLLFRKCFGYTRPVCLERGGICCSVLRTGAPVEVTVSFSTFCHPQGLTHTYLWVSMPTNTG